MIVAQITDMHVTRRGYVLPHMPHIRGPLRRALASILALRERPACILATGDLTENGHRDEYRRLRELIEGLAVPVFLIPGNHDRCDALRSVFHDSAYLQGAGDAVLFTVEWDVLRVVALDSSQAPRQGGYLDEPRLRWLDERLAERPATPTILAMHHPPFPTGLRYFDEQAFAGREELGEIVRAHPQIRRIVSGHVHQPFSAAWNGVAGITAPSTAPTLVLRPNARGVSFQAGGFLLHRTDALGTVRSRLVRTPPDALAPGA